ncbi:NAD(P)H-flavin reductase [Halomonas llamarensis]|uniref:NAD(P)H-flavin reductase n=1 Tax=Halomonas llamarensis TaxID=2945104 RepID=A0ABT0SNL9_9GAMM|nr:NAD(P)H-flavin reductase [Halomonas llamarensis]MCL7929397.1 NAD(P)H-flavin reductase [Halomonas llamarensis]
MSARTLTCQVTEVEDLNPDVFGVTLQGRAEAMQHAPGQYLEMHLDGDIWVPFSIASAERGDGQLELHIQHWPERDNSARLRELLQVANQLTVRLPGGDCIVDLESTRPLLLIAAGTGFAQMKAIIEAVLARQPNRQIDLWWAAREHRDLYLEPLACQWAQKHSTVTFHAVTEMPLNEPMSQGERIYHHLGRVDEALEAASILPSDYNVYLSGSPGMVYACVDILLEKGLEKRQMLSDVFSYAPR